MNGYCLICHRRYQPNVNWSYLLTLQKDDCLCTACRHSFSLIGQEVCRDCGRPLERLDPSYRQGDICIDCVRWQNDDEWKGVLTKNRSVYVYDDFMKEVIALWKFRGDYAIIEAFRDDVCREFYRHFSLESFLVPIPLSPERLYERGFNQAKALAELLPLPILDILERDHLEKQSKKSRGERLQAENVFRLRACPSLREKPLIVIDDIYTTGTTVRHAAKVLRQAGATDISSFTLARS
jgi:competence protein ComFC